MRGNQAWTDCRSRSHRYATYPRLIAVAEDSKSLERRFARRRIPIRWHKRWRSPLLLLASDASDPGPADRRGRALTDVWPPSVIVFLVSDHRRPDLRVDAAGNAL